MKDNKINPYSWDHISGDKYWEIFDILYDDNFTDIDKQARLCSAIEDIDLETFYSLPVIEAKKKIAQLDFLNDFKLKKHYHPKNIVIGGKKYNVMSDMSQLTVGQFVDYENFIQQPFRENYDKILSIFIIPNNYKYNDGYDVSKVQEIIREKMSFREVQSLANFIIVKFLKYFLNSLRYLTNQIKKMKGTERQEMEKKMEELKKKMKQLICFRF